MPKLIILYTCVQGQHVYTRSLNGTLLWKVKLSDYPVINLVSINTVHLLICVLVAQGYK